MGKLRTSAHILLDKAESQGDKKRFMVPVDSGYREIRWRAYLSYTEAVALFLHFLGIGLDKKVAIFAKTRVEWAYCGIAIQFCRGVFVPIYHSNTPEQVRYILRHSDSEVLFTESERLPTVLEVIEDVPLLKKIILFESEDEIDSILKSHNKEHIRDKFINLSSIYKRAGEIKEKSHISLRELVEKIEDEDLSAIIYTSGTTGTPKGVMLTNKNLITNAEDWIEVLGPLIPVERVDLLWLPTSHIFGWGELGLGNTLDFLTYFSDPKHVLDVMPYVKPTIFMSVPAYWEKLYRRALSSSNNKREQLKKLIELTGGKLKFCLSGGAGLKREVKEFFYEAGLLIIEGYGLTECSPTLTMNRGDDFDFDTVGKPFPRVKIKIAPDGEILAKGPNVFIGYYKDPGATKEAFDEDGWFKTGDLGEWTERGFLKIKGRKKDIIVTSGGKNIAPQPIESMFDDDPYIEHIVLYGNERKYLTALITLKEEAILRYAKEHNIPHSDFKTLVRDPRIYELIKERIEKVNKKLASFETIKKFYIHDGHFTVENGFLTPSLKLRRVKVYEAFKDKLDALYEEE